MYAYIHSEKVGFGCVISIRASKRAGGPGWGPKHIPDGLQHKQ